MDSVILVLLLLAALGDNGGKAQAKKVPPVKFPPEEQCPEGSPVVYDGPPVFGDIRKSDKAAGLTPAEQYFLQTTLTDVGSDVGLMLGPGLCTHELLTTVMVLPETTSWEVVLAMLVYGQAAGKGVPKWPLLTAQQRERVAMLALAVKRHQVAPADSDLEDEAGGEEQVRGQVGTALAVAWTVANKPLSTPPSWGIPAPHNTRKPGQTLHDWWTNYAFYWVYPTAPPKIVLPGHQVWVKPWNDIAALVTAEMS